MLAIAGELPPDDDNWAFEFKWDGVRAIARVDDGRLQLTARRGNDITASYPELHRLADEAGVAGIVLDGEIVAMSDGRPSFSALQNRMHVANPAQARRLAETIPVTYLVFDLLHLDGRSCLGLPYVERRALLEGLELDGPRWQTPPSFPGDGALVLAAAAQQRLEGVMAKRLTSRYHPGRRSPEWIKVPRVEALEVVIGGWREGEGKREGVMGSMLLGLPVRDADGAITGLRYVGQVGTGFSDELLRTLTRILDEHTVRASPFVTEVPRYRAKGARWVRPDLVGEVVFREWTPDGRLRFPSWRGLRPDKTPDDVPDDAPHDVPGATPDG